MKINLIAAVGRNNEMGLDNKLLWHIPEDLKRFKKITEGKPVIMGRKTYESIGKPLPNRKNIILSSQKQKKFTGDVVITNNTTSAMTHAQLTRADEVFVIGGAGVYKEFLPQADQIYLTIVHSEFQADTFFPELDMRQWEIASEEDVFTKEYILTNYVYKRKEKKDATKNRNRDGSKSPSQKFDGFAAASPGGLRGEDYRPKPVDWPR
jgi:dihydrofolate reductase